MRASRSRITCRAYLHHPDEPPPDEAENRRASRSARHLHSVTSKPTLFRNQWLYYPTSAVSTRKFQPDDWEMLTDAAQLRLHNAHAKAKRKHDIEMQTHWMTLAQQDRNQWRALVRGPEPESTRKAASRRARSARNGRRHGHQPLHFQPVNFVPAARPPVQFVPAGQPQNSFLSSITHLHLQLISLTIHTSVQTRRQPSDGKS